MKRSTKKKAPARGSMRDRARQRAEERKSAGGGSVRLPDGVDRFEPEKGTMFIDILPYEVTATNHPEVGQDDLWYQRTIWVHFGIGAEEKAYLCPAKTVGQRCPICEHRSELMKSADADEKTLEALRPRERELFNVKNVGPKGDDEIRVWEFSYHNFGKKLEEELREGPEEYAGFAELEGGMTLKLRFSEKKLGRNKFLEVSRIDFQERDEDYDESVLKDVVDLDEALTILPYEELERVFLELGDSDGKDEDDDEDEPRRPARKRRPEPDPDDEDEDEDEPPPRRKKKAKPAPPPEPEDEDEDDGDGDDDEQPEEGNVWCPACEGTGKSSRGKRCVPCKGSGQIADPDADDDGDDGEGDEDGDGDCPHGHTYAEDNDEYAECNDCGVWDACSDARDAAEKAAKKKGKRK